MKHTPYWWEDELLEKTKEPLPTKIDVAIIGAGYSGLNAALVLARAGVSVVVFEAGNLGEGASSRNGGMVGPSFHKLGVAGLKEKFGNEIANEILRESAGFVDYLEGFLEKEKIDADFKRTGRFLGARKPAHYDKMACLLDNLQQSCDVKGEMVPKSEQESETSSKFFHGGLIFHNDGGLNPAKYLNALAAKVREAGAQIFTQTSVNKLEKKSYGFELSSPKGKIFAQNVAVCTNGYTGKQFSKFRRRVLPIRSAMIASKELSPELIAKVMPKQRMYGDSRRIVAYYRPSPDGKRILWGGRATSQKDTPKANAKKLHQSMVEIYPELAKIKISHVWSGLVAYSFDHTPHIGQIEGLFYAMGYCGSGVSRASYFGNRLGHKILGNTEQGRTAFDELKFNSKPFYTGNPWFMPAVMNWHRMLDRLGL